MRYALPIIIQHVHGCLNWLFSVDLMFFLITTSFRYSECTTKHKDNTYYDRWYIVLFTVLAFTTDCEQDQDGDDAALEDMTAVPSANGQRAREGFCKKYGPWYVWGQLNNWYRQTIADPTATLSGDRRGTIALPDIECTFVRPRSRYSTKVCFILRQRHYLKLAWLERLNTHVVLFKILQNSIARWVPV